MTDNLVFYIETNERKYNIISSSPAETERWFDKFQKILSFRRRTKSDNFMLFLNDNYKLETKKRPRSHSFKIWDIVSFNKNINNDNSTTTTTSSSSNDHFETKNNDKIGNKGYDKPNQDSSKEEIEDKIPSSPKPLHLPKPNNLILNKVGSTENTEIVLLIQLNKIVGPDLGKTKKSTQIIQKN